MMDAVLYILEAFLSTGIYILTTIQVLGVSLLIWEAFFLVVHVVVRLLFLKSGG